MKEAFLEVAGLWFDHEVGPEELAKFCSPEGLSVTFMGSIEGQRPYTEDVTMIPMAMRTKR